MTKTTAGPEQKLDVIRDSAGGAEPGKSCLGEVPSAWWKYGILKLDFGKNYGSSRHNSF